MEIWNKSSRSPGSGRQETESLSLGLMPASLFTDWAQSSCGSPGPDPLQLPGAGIWLVHPSAHQRTHTLDQVSSPSTSAAMSGPQKGRGIYGKFHYEGRAWCWSVLDRQVGPTHHLGDKVEMPEHDSEVPPYLCILVSCQAPWCPHVLLPSCYEEMQLLDKFFLGFGKAASLPPSGKPFLWFHLYGTDHLGYTPGLHWGIAASRKSSLCMPGAVCISLVWKSQRITLFGTCDWWGGIC